MRAAYISNNFHICLFCEDLDSLKDKKVLAGFLVGHEIIWSFLIKILDKEKENTRIVMSKEFRTFSLLLNKSDFKKLFDNEQTLFSINTNVYFYTQKYNQKLFEDNLIEINKLALKAKSNQLSYTRFFDFRRISIFSKATA